MDTREPISKDPPEHEAREDPHPRPLKEPDAPASWVGALRLLLACIIVGAGVGGIATALVAFRVMTETRSFDDTPLEPICIGGAVVGALLGVIIWLRAITDGGRRGDR